MPEPGRQKIRFGLFEVDLQTGELRKNGVKVKLQDQPFRILVALLQHPGEVVTRDDLRAELWSTDTFVDFEHSLNAAIKRLRDALGDSTDNPIFIETLARRGYRFNAPIEKLTPPAARENPVIARPILRRRYLLGLAAIVIVLLVLLVGLDWVPISGWGIGASGRSIESLAVLPLENLSGDPAQEYFTDGMTDELITDLASIGGLRVISRTSTAHYKGTHKTLPEIARELNVDAVVEGSVTRSANKVRIRAQLIRATPEEHVWAESYERDLADVLAMQRDVASAIAGRIKVNLTPQEKARLALVRSVNPDAYEAYLLGNYYSSKRNTASIEKGIEYLQEAIRIDPRYAQAYASLANTYFEREIWGGLGLGTQADPIRANTLKALELDANLAEAHMLLARIHFQSDWDWPGAEAEFKRAIELNPNLESAYVYYAYLLQTLSRHTEALAAAHHAVELDPLSAPNICDEGRIMYRARQYENAIARYQRALELDPGYVPALGRMVDAYEQLGNHAEALAYVEKLQPTTGNRDPRLRYLAGIYARMGKQRQAVEILRTIEKKGIPGDDHGLAVIYCALGDHDRAITALERGFQMHSIMPFVFVDPPLDPLRTDPRFQQLLRRAALPKLPPAP